MVKTTRLQKKSTRHYILICIGIEKIVGKTASQSHRNLTERIVLSGQGKSWWQANPTNCRIRSELKPIFSSPRSRTGIYHITHTKTRIVAVVDFVEAAGTRHSSSKHWLCSRCCSVAVLQFKNRWWESQNLTLYLYINIEVFLGYGNSLLSFGYAAHMNEVSLENCNTATSATARQCQIHLRLVQMHLKAIQTHLKSGKGRCTEQYYFLFETILLTSAKYINFTSNWCKNIKRWRKIWIVTVF